jgi:hypothetical protein
MYVLEEKFDEMYRNRLPSLPNVHVREHVRCVDIRQSATVSGRMDVRAVTMDNRTITVQTTGDMTIGDIVDKICEAV